MSLPLRVRLEMVVMGDDGPEIVTSGEPQPWPWPLPSEGDDVVWGEFYGTVVGRVFNGDAPCVTLVLTEDNK